MTGQPPTDWRSRRSASARRSYSAGRWAEWAAILVLAAKGWRLLARRYGGKGGEIDLIMRRGDVIAFVEVKSRAAMDDALVAITPQKQRLIARQAARWRTENPWAATHSLRADAVFIGGRAWPRHVPHVFELEQPAA
jgi:putative endonuclease